jgi:alkyldihydroxyacetonephosphate synthase
MTAADAHPVDPPMQWNAWGDPDAAKPLSSEIRTLLSQALGVEGDGIDQPSVDQVQLRSSALSQADRDGLSSIVGAGNVTLDDRSRLLRAGGKSTLDLLRRRDFGVQDAPDAVLLPGGEDEIAEVLRYCTEHGIAVVPFGGGTSVVGGLDPVRGEFNAVVSLDLRRLNELHTLD